MINRAQREHGAGPGTIEAEETSRLFFQQVQHAVGFLSSVDAADASITVLATLLEMLTQVDAQVFVAAMPSSLRILLSPRAQLRESERPRAMDGEQFLERVGERLHIGREASKNISHQTLLAAQVWLPRDAVVSLERQIPRDLRELWRHSS